MIGEKVTVETLPALSVHVPVELPFAVSVVNICCAGAEDKTPELATVERSSTHEKVTVTFWLVQAPAAYALGPATAVADSAGGVLSIMIGPNGTLTAVFVATSEHVAASVVPGVSAVRVMVAVDMRLLICVMS